MEQKLFWPFVPKFPAEFLAPPEFSSCVTEKMFKHRMCANLWPSDYEADILPLRHSILVNMMLRHSLCSLLGFPGRFCSYWQLDFPAVSVVKCRDFLAWTFPARECKKSPSRDQKAGIFRPYLLFLPAIFRPLLFWHRDILKKLYGRQANCSGINSGIFCP